MTNERYWWSSTHWFGPYYIYIGQFQTPAAMVDTLLFLLLGSTTSWSFPEPYREHSLLARFAEVPQWTWMAGFAAWVFFTKTVKLFPHFWRHPADFKFLPVSIASGYIHGVINIYALCTVHYTHWGSQNPQALAQAHAPMDETPPLVRDSFSGGRDAL